MAFQLHKDFRACIESARVACFPHSRGCDDFFHFSQKQQSTMVAKCQKVACKNGKWAKANAPYVVSVVLLIRLLPTLPLFSKVWAGFLAHLQALGEPQLVQWLQTYERPLPWALAQKHSQPLTYVSMWRGLEGCVPGSGSGSQPAEALHAGWQKQLSQLAGKGTCSHVLGVMQRLYRDAWLQWFGWDSADAPSLHFHVQARSVCLDLNFSWFL